MRRLQQRVESRVPLDVIWDVLADFGGVEKWAPGMRRSWLIGDLTEGVGTRRAMRHRLGFRIEERVTGWEEGKTLAFELLQAPFPMRDVHETWKLGRHGNLTRIDTTVDYKMGLGPIGYLLDLLLVRFLVQREMRNGLRAIARYAEKLTVIRQLAHPEQTLVVPEPEAERQVS